jgi:hypothetical protein
MESYTLYTRDGTPALTVDPAGNLECGPGITTEQIRQLHQPEAAMGARLHAVETELADWRRRALQAEASLSTIKERGSRALLAILDYAKVTQEL